MSETRLQLGLINDRGDGSGDARGRRFVEIRRLDAMSDGPVRAAAYLGPAGYRTYAAPQRFLGIDGRRYRVKSRAQGGLGSELVANRFGSYLGIAPATVVLDIGAPALPADRSLQYLAGRQVASEELDAVLNDDELRALDVTLRPEQVDWESWAQVVCFQTWLYMGDPQAVIRMSDGRVFSIDHGKSFEKLIKGPPTGVIVPSLRGISGIAFPSTFVLKAVERIERISEGSVLAMVAGVPDGDAWRMGIEMRLRVAEWLIGRQPRVREVMEPWMPRIS